MVKVRTGLRQGDALLPILFNLILKKLKEVLMDRTKFSLLAYQDNIVLLEKEKQKVVDLCGKLMELVKRKDYISTRRKRII